MQSLETPARLEPFGIEESLAEEGFLRSSGPRNSAPIGFPLAWRERLFPTFFADVEIVASDPRDWPRP